MSKIAVIGHGFVGRAVERGFEERAEVIVVDPAESELRIADLPDDLAAALVCVPTPVGEGGRVDCSIARDVVEQLRDRYPGGDPLVIVKSTLTPDALGVLADAYRPLVYSPEFLTERDADRDFVNPPMQVFGSRNAWYASEALRIFRTWSAVDARAPVYLTTLEEASLIKYSINSFLATKVTFFNELRELCERAGADFETVRLGVSTDPRIGDSHTRVPGPDGRLGWGGACLSKDTVALVSYSDSVGAKTELVESAIEINDEVRSQYEPNERERVNNVTFGRNAA